MHTLRGMHIVAPVETVMRGHRIVEPKRIRRIYASSTGSGIMGSESLSGRCYIGRCLLGRCLRILQSSSGMRTGRIPRRRDQSSEGVSIHGGGRWINKYRDVVESRIVNLKQWPRYRLGNPARLCSGE